MGEQMSGVTGLDPEWNVDPETVRPVAEGVWYADRRGTHSMGAFGSIRHGVYWTADGKKVVSLATGDGLHAWGGVDYETFVFRPSDVDIDVCCHATPEAAERCALTFFAEGHWCRVYEDEE